MARSKWVLTMKDDLSSYKVGFCKATRMPLYIEARNKMEAWCLLAKLVLIETSMDNIRHSLHKHNNRGDVISEKIKYVDIVSRLECASK